MNSITSSEQGQPRLCGPHYRGQLARQYDQKWAGFCKRTLSKALTSIDWARLPQGGNVLDAGCGTGILLAEVLRLRPDLCSVGFDASNDMLDCARKKLTGLGTTPVQLVWGSFGNQEPDQLPTLISARAPYHLITLTNLLHYLPDPPAAFRHIASLLAPGGQFVLVNFTCRPAPFPWPFFERLLHWLDPAYRQTYSLPEARCFVADAGLQVQHASTFNIDWLWHGLLITATKGE